jgi:integrase
MASSPGVTVRHGRNCPAAADRDAKCRCTPSYQAHVLVRGRRLRKTFPTPTAARNWRQDQASAARRGAPIAAPSRRTMRDAIEEFTTALEDGTALKRGNRSYKPSVARLYRLDLRGRVLEELGHVRLNELSRADLQRFVESLTAGGPNAKPLSASRARGIIVAIQALLRREIRAQRLVGNPAEDLDLPALPAPDETVVTPDHVADLIDALAESDRVLWALAGYAGMRRGEIRGLRVSDIDLAGNAIRITRAIDDLGLVVAPKSRRGERRVPLAPQLRAIVLEHLARTGRRDDDLVTGRTRTDPFTPTHIAKRARETWETENERRKERHEELLQIVGLHRLRHAWVSAMLAAGAPVASVALWAGHDVRVMADVYHHAIPGRGQEDGETIGAVFSARHLRDNGHPHLAVLSGSERRS